MTTTAHFILRTYVIQFGLVSPTFLTFYLLLQFLHPLSSQYFCIFSLQGEYSFQLTMMKLSQVCPACQIFCDIPISTDLPSQGCPRQLFIALIQVEVTTTTCGVFEVIFCLEEMRRSNACQCKTESHIKELGYVCRSRVFRYCEDIFPFVLNCLCLFIPV